MIKDTVRGPNFEVKVQDSTGAYTVYQAGEVRTYIGTVDEFPDAVVAGFMNRSNQLEAKIFLDRGKTITTKAGAGTGTGGTAAPGLVFPSPNETYITTKNSVFRYTNAIDVSNNYFASSYIGSDINIALDRIEYTLCKVKVIYLRDVCIMPCLGRVIIRTSAAKCPYAGITSVYNAISLISTEWNNNQKDAKRFIASETDTRGGAAGVGYCPGAYSAWGAGSAGDLEATARHELGHNWSALDYHAGSSAGCPEGPTVMCGNSISRFAGNTAASILKYRDGKTKNLDSLGNYTKIKIPPYARLDPVTVNSGNTSTLIDVLNNDLDCNGDALTLVKVDSLSKNGTAISRSIGTGPGGRDQVQYGKSSGTGVDYFYYKIADASGKTSTGLVLIQTSNSIVNSFNETVDRSWLHSVSNNIYIIDVKSAGKFSASFFNSKGVCVSLYKGIGPVNQQIKIKSLPSGVYILKLITEHQTLCAKVMIKR